MQIKIRLSDIIRIDFALWTELFQPVFRPWNVDDAVYLRVGYVDAL